MSEPGLPGLYSSSKPIVSKQVGTLPAGFKLENPDTLKGDAVEVLANNKASEPADETAALEQSPLTAVVAASEEESKSSQSADDATDAIEADDAAPISSTGESKYAAEIQDFKEMDFRKPVLGFR